MGASDDDSTDQKSNSFDPRRLRLSQRQANQPLTRRLVASVQVRKPTRQEFFRVHPEMRLETYLLDARAEGATYLVDPTVAEAIPGDVVAKVLYLTVTTHGAVLLWPVRLPDDKGRLDDWNSAAHEAALAAETNWIRIIANHGAGTYEVFAALDQTIEPKWPELTLERLLELAFKNRHIESLDHRVVRSLMGEF